MLDILSSEIKACRICRDAPRYGAPLPDEPNPVCVLSATARIVICGQAPGIRVHNTGLPFNDPSGVRLRDWLGVDRETFYDPDKFAIVPMGFCFPGYDAHGSDLPPRRECRETWHDRVFHSMPQIELVLTIGQYAQAYHLGQPPPRQHDRRRCRTGASTSSQQPGRSVLPLAASPPGATASWLKKEPLVRARTFSPCFRRRSEFLIPIGFEGRNFLLGLKRLE